MPLCTGKPIYDLQHGNLGVCHGCAIRIAVYFDKLAEMPEVTEARLQRRYRERADAEKQQREAEQRAMTPGWIYYIKVDDRIKIGYSTDVRKRMRAYPPHAELLAVHPGTLGLEGEMHTQFVGHLAAGREWFHPGKELLDHIARVVQDFGEPDGRHVYKFREGQPQQIKIHRTSRRTGSGQRRR